MKTKLLAMMLLAGGAMFAQPRFSVGIGFNQAPPAYASIIPPCPGPGYTWVDGYWSQNYGQPVWIAGYWSAPAFTASFGFAPRFDDHFHGGFDRDRNFNGRDHDQSRSFNQSRNSNPGPARGSNQGQNHGRQNGRSNGHDDRGNGNSFRGR